MPNSANTNTDAGKDIQPFTQSVLNTIASFRNSIDLAASAAGVSGLSIAAPIAREMNKVDVGDYGHVCLGAL